MSALIISSKELPRSTDAKSPDRGADRRLDRLMSNHTSPFPRQSFTPWESLLPTGHHPVNGCTDWRSPCGATWQIMAQLFGHDGIVSGAHLSCATRGGSCSPTLSDLLLTADTPATCTLLPGNGCQRSPRTRLVDRRPSRRDAKRDIALGFTRDHSGACHCRGPKTPTGAANSGERTS